MKNGKPPTLDERIATTIGSTDQHAAAVLADLIRETEEQIAHCDQLGRNMRERSINPAILDPAARGAAEDSEFRAARLRNGLARLLELHREAELRQQLIDWHRIADLAEERAVKLADELLERWPAVTSWIMDYLQRKSLVDAEVRHINETAPGAEGRRLREIELVARGISDWGASQPIEKQLKLPALVIGSDAVAPLLWPVRKNLGLEMVSGLFPSNGSIHDDTPVLRFEFIDGVVRKVGMDGQLIDEKPMVPLEPLHPEISLRDQRLAEQRETAIELERHAADGIAREKERERLNSVRHNEELQRRQEAISK